jgi:hypothetical protein
MTDPEDRATPASRGPEHAPARPRIRRATLAGGGVALVALLALALAIPGPAMAGGPGGGGARPLASTAAPPNASWAWGGAANLSYSVSYAGLYDRSLNLTGGNLSSSTAYIVLNESARVGYASYAIVNATSPNPQHRSVEMRALQARYLALSVAASGTFPVAGSYAANQSVPLAPTSFGLAAREVVVNAYVGFLNFTLGANGTVALTDEHLASAEGINVSMDATNFPNVTAGPNGSETIAYQTISMQALGYVTEEMNATFSPGLTVLAPPLTVGSGWNSTTNASVVGRIAYASAIAVSSGGQSAAYRTSGGASANASGVLSVAFRVVNTTLVRMPDGTLERDYVISAASGNSTSQFTVWDGLLVVPSSDPTASAGVRPAVGVRPAAAPLAPGASPATRAVVSPSRGLPVAAQATPSGGATVLSAPLSSSAAEAAMHGVGTPTPPPANFGTSANGAGGAIAVAIVVVPIVGTTAYLLGRRRGRRTK